MKNTFGSSVCVTLFGESHGAKIGAVLDGLAPGIPVDTDLIRHQLTRRRPAGRISTARQEQDDFEIVSGVFEGRTTGTPLTILIPNADTRSGDYRRGALRPGHADYTAHVKYHGFEDYRGGGHFSGRITAALTAVGAVAVGALRNHGIRIATHVSRCAGIADAPFTDPEIQMEQLNQKSFAVLDDERGMEMRTAIEAAAEAGDSVGGVLETMVTGMPAGVGEPWFDTLESMLAHALFSVPAVKGVEFGDGFSLAEKKGSEANDAFTLKDGKTTTKTNHNGGVNGGISNGMPIVFRCAVKPTPSIALPQESVNAEGTEEEILILGGRHDPAVVHRARVVVDSVTALVLCDALAQRFGTDFLKGDPA